MQQDGQVRIQAPLTAVRPKAVLMPAAIASEMAWAGLAWASRPAHVPRLLRPDERPACGEPVRRDDVRGFAAGGVAVQIRGGSAIFDSLAAGFAGSAGL